MLKKTFFFILAVVLTVVSGCSSQKQSKPQQINQRNASFEIVRAMSLNVKNIQGLGFPGNENALYIATDKGLKFYKSGGWFETSAGLDNYIGFQALSTGFLASGHPEKGTGLKDPLGVVKSTDRGKTLLPVAFYGQDNFPFLSADFSGRVIYILNEEQNGNLNYGVNYSDDGGKTWKKSGLNNFKADSLGMIAVHPANGNIMAMATRSGVFYSEDFGKTMKMAAGPVMVTAVSFLGSSILYSSVVEGGHILLSTVNPKTGQHKNVPIPLLDQENPITYIAVNEKNENQMAFSTYNNDLYESKDGGKDWNLLLKNGKTEQQ